MSQKISQMEFPSSQKLKLGQKRVQTSQMEEEKNPKSSQNMRIGQKRGRKLKNIKRSKNALNSPFSTLEQSKNKESSSSKYQEYRK